MQEIILTADAGQSFDTELDFIPVTLTIWYQDIGGWFCDADVNGSPVVRGARLNSRSLFFGQVISGLPGDIMPIPLLRPATELSRDSWNSDHALVYLTREELEGVNASII